MTAAARPPAPPPPAKPAAPAPGPGSQKARTFGIESGAQRSARRIGLYGPGGIGKTSLASHLMQVGIEPFFIDLDRGSVDHDVKRVAGVETFQDLRDALHAPDLFPEGSAVVIDSATAAEKLAVTWTLENVPHEKGHKVKSIEDYGFGKGYQHVCETFLKLLGDLDQLYRGNRHVVLIMHECISNVPNPTGEDWIRYEPRMQSPSSGKSSIRHAVKEWLDDLLFIGYDVAASRDGKAAGSGTRTIYPQEMPTHWAKSRRLREPLPYLENDVTLWQQLFHSKES